jgi:hypothetical protein
MGGGIEAIYDDMNRPIGVARFAPVRRARGAMFSARRGAGQGAASRRRSSPCSPRRSTTPASVAPGGVEPVARACAIQFTTS